MHRAPGSPTTLLSQEQSGRLLAGASGRLSLSSTLQTQANLCFQNLDRRGHAGD